MTEIDKKHASTPVTTKRDLVKKVVQGMVAVRFEATFLGGMSPKNEEHGADTGLIATSVLGDPKAMPEAVIKGGHNSVVLTGSFMDYIPQDSPAKNVIQKLSRSTLHIGEAPSQEPLDEASKPPTIAVNQSSGDVPERKIYLTVLSGDEVPEESIKSWFYPQNELEAAA